MLTLRRHRASLGLLRATQRCFSATGPTGYGSHFDTYDLYRKLLGTKDLDSSQSQALQAAFSKVLQSHIATCTLDAVSKPDFGKTHALNLLEYSLLKNDIIQKKKNEVAAYQSSQERLDKDLGSIQNNLKEKLESIASELRLEMSLEKSKFNDSSLDSHLKYQDFYFKIDTETSNSLAATKKLRHDLFYSLFGIFFTSSAVILGFLRFLTSFVPTRQLVTMTTNNSLVSSKRIAFAKLYRKNPLWKHFYVLHFGVLYAIWFSYFIPQLVSTFKSFSSDPVAFVSLLNLNPTNSTLGAVNNTTLDFSTDSSHEISNDFVSFMGYFFHSSSNDALFISLLLLVLAHVLVFLMTIWSVSFKAKFTCSQVSSPDQAHFILVQPAVHHGSPDLCPIFKSLNPNYPPFSFEFQKNKFVWDKHSGRFIKTFWAKNWSASEYLAHNSWQDQASLDKTKNLFGLNALKISTPQFQELFKEHVVAPFFVFQIFCFLLWALDDYWYYSLLTLVMLFAFESTVVLQRIRNLNELNNMSLEPIDLNVYRCKQWTKTSSINLIPGDLVSLVSNGETIVPCDMILIGGSCIVNEALISGESTPLLKECVTKDVKENTKWDVNGQGKINALFGGTKLLQITPPQAPSLQGPDSGCLAIVLRTGFKTVQGKLVRTMYYNSERLSANNKEALFFILFLLVFALSASVYVWIHTIKEDPTRSNFKLLLKCLLIITAVVPPELPMELSLAVNTSLAALSQLAIFCTEPFRIPFAGKVDICCFDKTGTLTDENLLVKGLCGTNPQNPTALSKDYGACPQKTLFTIASCHSLIFLQDKVSGDPMEKASLEAIDWKVGKNDHVSSIKYKPSSTIVIVRRFPFSSVLRRMAVIANVNTSISGSDSLWFAGVKGAPEALYPFFTNPPSWYNSVYQDYARKGARIISLGFKSLASNTKEKDIRDFTRESIESSLEFVGFLIFDCPLKKDTKASVQLLQDSLHKVVMITGDHVLTGIHVAQELQMMDYSYALIDVADDEDSKNVKSSSLLPNGLVVKKFNENTLVLENVALPGDGNHTNDIDNTRGDDVSSVTSIKPGHYASIFSKTALNVGSWVITGQAFDILMKKKEEFMEVILPYTSVYARFSPKNKEDVLRAYKELQWTTLMCGDGTNDVGALKQAHVGVALLDGTPEDLIKIQEHAKKTLLKARQIEKRPGSSSSQKAPPVDFASVLNDLSESEVPTIKFGNASIASPFTSKLSSINSVCSIIKQGRCTLATTVQMYKILALNALIGAYSLSVLHLAGVRNGDFQLTISSLLIASLFLFLSKSKPLDQLSSKRPPTSIFNAYMMTSILGQFFVHVFNLFYIQHLATSVAPVVKLHPDDSTFEPTLLNSSIYLLALIMQVSTFAVNYQGKPFRENLTENKGLFKSLLIVGGIAFLAASQLAPSFNQWLELVQFPVESHFQFKLLAVMIGDLLACYLIERFSSMYLAVYKPRWMTL